ncbi:MAG TPA: hypothetical protein DCP03_13340 [Polaromonas sp.]|uniref:restriction endonuclease subunit S n=1 Tax=Polaromonas sp. UBA4122 TaxID=1947074 RepID=UPI000EE41BA1|nr:restriction endonuclease subunit S [Polaromonas sp. UBA4122]HAL39030.1 hypothetical protein [Polaromonas sp.]
MSEVTFAPLASFADVTMGQSPGTELCNADGKGLPFLQGCAEFGARNPHTFVFCDPPLRSAKAESVLISVRAPVGTMNYADQDYCIGRGLGSFKAKPNIANTVFLKHAVEHGAGYLHRRSQGSTFAAVSTDDVRTVPIPVFGCAKQNKIAAILSSIDTAIEQTEALIEKYQHIKAGLMHDLFTRGVLPTGQLRPPREQAPELYQETAIGWIPKEWRFQNVEVALESVADGPFGSNLKTEHYVADAGVQVVRLQNIAEYEYDDSDKAYISNRHACFLIRNKVVSGDVLIAGLGDERYAVGRACCYPAELPSAVNKADCFRARCKSTVMENKFFMLFLNSELARRQMRRFEQGVTRPRINTGNLKRVAACIPDLDEQNRIISKFDAMQKTIRAQITCMEALRAQKLGLMQDLLTGKVAVKVNSPDNAPAHA